MGEMFDHFPKPKKTPKDNQDRMEIETAGIAFAFHCKDLRVSFLRTIIG
jgi:hypothetical protein